MVEVRYRKETEVDEDPIADDLILMHLVTRKVVIVNETCRVLWDAIEAFPTRSELLDLLREALPEHPETELAAGLDSMLDSLVTGGFLHAEQGGTTLPAAA